MANDSLTLDQVITEAKSAEIRNNKIKSNRTAADLSKINGTNDKRVPDYRRGRHKFKKGKNGKDDDKTQRSKILLQMWSSAKPPS